jgi:hypothetical protein
VDGHPAADLGLLHRLRRIERRGWSGTCGYEFAEAFLGGAANDPAMDSWRMPSEALLQSPRTSPPFSEPLNPGVRPVRDRDRNLIVKCDKNHIARSPYGG